MRDGPWRAKLFSSGARFVPVLALYCREGNLLSVRMASRLPIEAAGRLRLFGSYLQVAVCSPYQALGLAGAALRSVRSYPFCAAIGLVINLCCGWPLVAAA